MIKLFNFFSLILTLLTSLFSAHLAAAPTDNFGRLFSRPVERNNLDMLRQNQKLKVITAQENLAQETAINAAPLTLAEPVMLQGYVKRGDGTKSTIWINSHAVQEDSEVDNVQIGKLNQQGFSIKGASTEGVDVKIPANGKHIRLKAGQMYAPETNEIRELQLVEKAKRLNLQQTGVIDDAD